MQTELIKGVWRSYTHKYDLQLRHAQDCENELAKALGDGARIELKSEKSWIWGRTGNVSFEYHSKGRKSGIAATEADYWAVQLLDRAGKVRATIILPIDRATELARQACREGRKALNCGDHNAQDVALVPIKWLTQSEDEGI